MAPSRLRIIAYNVRFGDAILLEVPDRCGSHTVLRHVLIDVGNVLSGGGGPDSVFQDVLEDVLARLDGKPVDLYVMSHEHLDHVKGLSFGASLGLRVPVDFAWLPASAADDYYERHPLARTKMWLAREEFARIRLAVAERGLTGMASAIAFLQNNDPAATGACVDFLKRMASKKTVYVHRRRPLVSGRDHPFVEARLSVWAPEPDTSVYYGRFKPFLEVESAHSHLRRPPAGVDWRAFRDLIDFLEAGLGDSMLAIDRTANNTSVVFMLEWRGWRLLFPGDAELASWRMMDRYRKLKPIHLLKVAHHGSRNGTPADDLLDKILPLRPPDSRPRYALLSSWPETYSGVPDGLTIQRLSRRVDHLVSTRSVPSGRAVTLELEG